LAPGGDAPTPLSYAAAAVSGLLIAFLMGYLAYDALSSSSPPRITAAVVSEEFRRDDGQSYVPIDVANGGDEAATEVVLEIMPEPPGAGLQTIVDYLAGGESRRIVALVGSGAAGSFRVRVVSYQEP
jgi:uncharacterized protein (TIGR02588 family)